jgi:hypothetical protein
VLESLLVPYRAKIRVAAAQVVCYAVAGIAAAVALGFALAALLSWLSTLYGTIVACLIVAGGFLVIALIPLFVLMSIRRRERLRVAEEVAKARSQAWMNPATLSLGLQALRMVGRNRGIAAGAVGALLIGWMVSQLVGGRDEDKADEADEAAE